MALPPSASLFLLLHRELIPDTDLCHRSTSQPRSAKVLAATKQAVMLEGEPTPLPWADVLEPRLLDAAPAPLGAPKASPKASPKATPKAKKARAASSAKKKPTAASPVASTGRVVVRPAALFALAPVGNAASLAPPATAVCVENRDWLMTVSAEPHLVD